MRLQADGRNIKDTTINHKFAQFTDTLYHVEDYARKEAEERSKIKQSVEIANAMRKEEEIRKEAAVARAERTKLQQMTKMSELE